MKRELAVNLFTDVILPVTLDEVELDLSGSYVWRGHVDGDIGSSVSIAVKDDAISALFSLRDHTYSLSTSGDAYEARELDPSAFPEEIAPIAVSLPRLDGTRVAATAVASDAAPVIDVLVAYTNMVRNGAPYNGSKAAVESLVSNAVAATNAAYANSGVTARLRLVGSMEVSYDDTKTGFSTTLSRLATNGDGYMDDVLLKKAQLGADAVSLLVYAPTDNACGVGYMMQSPPGPQFASSAFNVVRDDCAVDNLSFPHELGHNFGLEHDRATAGNSSPSYPYAFGYQDTAGTFRDIMAYNCSTGCPRIQYFSNPDLSYNGRPLGVLYTLPSAADNRRALNNNAAIIAAWAPTAVSSFTFTDDPLVAGSTFVKALDVTELRAAINSVRTAAGLSPATWSDATLSTVKASHIVEMRSALVPALTALNRTVPTFTDSSLSAGTAIKAAHIQELRNALK